MKPKNMPARKLARQLKAQGIEPSGSELSNARMVRTKKVRSR